ncbi:MAG: ABC transporter substrate-binding protein [Treponema sp.]|nr:ABC transporter substrate-binding protein [Treponema sp.]
MKMNKKSVIAIAIVAAAVVASVVAVAVWKAQPKGMTVAVSTLPDSLNPVLEQNTSGLNADELVFDGLTNFEITEDSSSGRGVLYADLALAEYIEQDTSDKKTYTVTLRDVYWHDSTAEKPHVVTADDVAYSYQAYVLPENNSPKRDYILSFIENVQAVDEKTVKVLFKNPIPEFRAYPVLTFKIIPHFYKGQEMSVNLREGENERNFATSPVGTGPFKLANWEIGKWLTFNANGLYSSVKNVPQADSLVIKRTIDPIVRMNELRKGSINMILETNPMDRASVAKIDNVDINSYMPYAFYDVEINTSLFQSAEGRQAMAMALDKRNLIPGITDQRDGVVLNNGPFPSNLFAVSVPDYYKDDVPNLLTYNLEKAKSLAEKGGISGQNAILIYPDSMGDFGKQMAEGIVAQLSKIGLNVEARRTGDQVFNRMVNKEKSFELALVYREGFDNVYSSMGAYYRSGSAENVTGIADKELDSLFDEWEKTNVTKDWIDLTLKINKRVSELSPALYLCSLQKDVYSRGLSNILIATDNPFLSAEDWKFKD